LFVFVLLASLVMAIHPGRLHARAASLLMRFASAEEPKPWLAQTYAYEVDERDSTLEAPTGPTRARFYEPRGVSQAPAMVLIPGVHRLGVDEPRLRRFARAIASSGVVVFTPEVKALTEYRIQPESIGTIGAATRALAVSTHHPRVGVMGMSFAGGLSLLAASSPEWRDSIAFVVAVGAHDDLARVARFFATDAIDDAEGHMVHMKAHDYGTLVLVHDHAEDFFAPGDIEGARDALRHWLWGEEPEARKLAEKLPPAARDKIVTLFDKKGATLSPEILAVVERRQAFMHTVSPHGHLDGIRAPVYLLHGAGDSVIPASETGWLAKEVPPEYLRSSLVSPAIQHVELHGEPSVGERWALVHFMAQVLEEAAR
jgi:dienelactone hydrolase